MTITPDAVTATSTRELAPGEGLTLAVGFAKGAIPSPTPLTTILRWLQARLVLGMPLAAGVAL